MINKLAKEIFENSKAKGFTHDNFPGMIALIHSEVSEALEHDRNGRYFGDGGQIHIENFLAVRGSAQEFYDWYGKHVKETVEAELADIIIRVLDMAASKGIDLDYHIRAKMEYNALRPFKHGGKKY